MLFTRVPVSSRAGRLAHFVVDFRESLARHRACGTHLVKERVVKHLAELFARLVHVGVQHLNKVRVRKGGKNKAHMSAAQRMATAATWVVDMSSVMPFLPEQICMVHGAWCMVHAYLETFRVTDEIFAAAAAG